MDLCFLDYETYWSVDHSLTKMNPIHYVMHQETEIQSVSFAMNNEEIIVLFGEDDIRHAWRNIRWGNTMPVAHNNSGFDALIHAWRFGVYPKAWGCTLAMAKPFYAISVGGSLKKVSHAMGLTDTFGAKGSLDEVNTKGKKLKDFTPDEVAKMRIYNKQDTELCRQIFYGLAPKLSKQEMKLIDLSIRMTVEPMLEANIPLLKQSLEQEMERKKLALVRLASMSGTYKEHMTTDEAASAMRDVVMSQPQFANLLTQIGVPIPMKASKTAVNPDGTPKMIPALAKQDEGMTALLDYEDPFDDEDKRILVQTAAATRLEVKSTQLETRLRTYALVAECLGGKLPMPVNYCGAAISWRFSGGMKMNVQNNPRVDPNKPKATDSLRGSIQAPKGKKIVVVDSSNIELRVAHAISGQMDTIEKLKNKEDLYCWFASTLFGRTITKADKDERFIGKVAMLSLQYGASWTAFQNMARVLSGGKTILSEDECKRIVAVWRSMFRSITDRKEGMWMRCDRAIDAMFNGMHTIVDPLGLCQTSKEIILTPGQHWLSYPDLRKSMNSKGKDEWVYGQGQNKSRLYGAHLFENMCQHLARIIVMEQTLALDKYYPVVLTCHDEAVMCVDVDEAEDAKVFAVETFSKSPKWWPDLPLAAEADIGDTYAEAK